VKRSAEEIAALAMLPVEGQQAEAYTADIEEIFAAAESLCRIARSDAADPGERETACVCPAMPLSALREDSAGAPDGELTLIGLSPRRDGQYLRVARTVE